MNKPSNELLSLAIHYSKIAYQRQRKSGVHNTLTDTTAFIDFEGATQIVTWPGSNSLRDWIQNAGVLPVWYKRHWVHAGFGLAHKTIWKKVKAQLDPHMETIFCGHSRGGTLAECCLLDVKGFKKVHMVTFGKPNLFARWERPKLSQFNIISVVHGSDIVTRVPRFGYKPNPDQDMLYLANDGTDHWNPSKKFRRRDWRKAQTLWEHGSDHLLPGYEERIIKYMKENKS